MRYSTKTKIGIVVGIGLIVFVVSLLNLPFMNTDSSVQKITQKSIDKVEESEEKLLDFITHEKAELAAKTNGAVSFP
jgi:hypothetical protein